MTGAALETRADAGASLRLPTGLFERLRPSIVRVAGRGQGASGIVYRHGTVLTNHHVVAATDGAPSVGDADGRVRAARVIDVSRELDLALLELAGGDDLPPAPFGESGRLRVGELVFAVGHPWGQPWVVTAGIVSGLGPIRLPGQRRAAAYVRSDVRLAPGNSGGPLLDARGEVVGLNAMVIGGDLSVAVPSDVARRWLERVR